MHFHTQVARSLSLSFARSGSQGHTQSRKPSVDADRARHPHDVASCRAPVLRGTLRVEDKTARHCGCRAVLDDPDEVSHGVVASQKGTRMSGGTCATGVCEQKHSFCASPRPAVPQQKLQSSPRFGALKAYVPMRILLPRTVGRLLEGRLRKGRAEAAASQASSQLPLAFLRGSTVLHTAVYRTCLDLQHAAARTSGETRG